MEEKTLRILVAGNDGSGKTSFVAVLQGVMTESGSCPMVVSDWTKEERLGQLKYSIRVTDMTCSHVLTSIDLVLLMFDVNNRESFLDCQTAWIPEIQKLIPKGKIVLIGNKTDLRSLSILAVKTEEGQQVAEKLQLLGYFELSVIKERHLVVEVLYESIRRYLKPTLGSLVNELVPPPLPSIAPLSRVRFNVSSNDDSICEILRVVILGSRGSGKSTFMWCLIHQTFPSLLTSSISTEWRTTCKIDNVPYSLEVFDMSGITESQTMFTSLVNVGTSVVILLYDATAPSTFNDCQNKWFPHVNRLAPKATIALVGTHKDQKTVPFQSNSVVITDQGQQFANQIEALFYEIALPNEAAHVRTIVSDALEHYVDHVFDHKRLTKKSVSKSEQSKKSKSQEQPIQAPVDTALFRVSSGNLTLGTILKDSTSNIKPEKKR